MGHIHIATAAQKALNLDRIIFLPCKQSPHKANQSLASEAQRLEMCKLATASLAWAHVDDLDLTSSAPSYSWRTVETMKARFPDAEIFWLMGTDQWDALPRWDRLDHLVTLVDFIVFNRGSTPEPRANITMHAIEGSHPASATQIRAGVTNQLTEQWLAPNVMDYIKTHKIYAF